MSLAGCWELRRCRCLRSPQYRVQTEVERHKETGNFHDFVGIAMGLIAYHFLALVQKAFRPRDDFIRHKAQQEIAAEQNQQGNQQDDDRLSRYEVLRCQKAVFARGHR